MTLLPHASGTRPRLACEIFQGSVVAGRSPEPGLPLAAVGRADLPDLCITPGLKPGNIADRVAVISAIRRAMDAADSRSAGRNGDLTLIIPDAAVRVLLLDFDSLPTKLSEALPIVRFRLKKLVPFDTETAMVSFQVMSTSRSVVRVLALAIPQDVLAEYESVAREAGLEPGAVLPSTLAALAALDEGEGAALLVNAHPLGVTTAIVRAGILLLHRSVELLEAPAPTPAGVPAQLFSGNAVDPPLLPLVHRDDTEAEWAAQEPLPEFGRDPYRDRLLAEQANQDQDSVTNLGSPVVDLPRPSLYDPIDMHASEAAPPSRSPYASPVLQQQLDAQFHNAAYIPPSAAEGVNPPPASFDPVQSSNDFVPSRETSPVLSGVLSPEAQAEEIARAVSVAVAFFEDTLAIAPEVVLSAGSLGAESLSRTLREQGVALESGVRVRELVDPSAVAPNATTAAIPRGWLAGITGALRS